MAVKQILVTKEGIVKLEAELAYLRDVRRLEVIETLRLSRESGGVLENAEYGIILQKVGQCPGVGYVIDGGDFHFRALVSRPSKKTADPAKTVYGDFDAHG